MKNINKFVNESLSRDSKEAKAGEFFDAVVDQTHVCLLISNDKKSPTGRKAYVILNAKYNDDPRYSSGYNSRGTVFTPRFEGDFEKAINGDAELRKEHDQRMIDNGKKLILLDKRKYKDLDKDLEKVFALWWRAPHKRGVVETMKNVFDGNTYYLNMWTSREYRHEDEYDDSRRDDKYVKMIEKADALSDKISKILSKYDISVEVQAW